MDNTLIGIGKTIINDSVARSKYHPMLSYRNLAKGDKGKYKVDESIASFEIFVDMDNKTVSSNNLEIIPQTINVIRFVLSSADATAKYLCGNSVIKKEKFLQNLSFKTFQDNCVKNYSNITESSIIYAYREVLNDNFKVLEDLFESVKDIAKIKEIALIVSLKLDGVTGDVQSFPKFLDEIDEMFIESNYFEDKGYTFKKSFYNMFNYGKYNTNGRYTTPPESIPYYEREDFTYLYYAKNLYEKRTYVIDKDYSITILPNFQNLLASELETLMFRGKDIFNFNVVCEEIESFINSRIVRDEQSKKIIPSLIKFDIYYRYKNGKAGDQNMLKLSNVRYAQIFKIKNHIKEAYKKTYQDRDVPNFFLKAILFKIYQDYNKDSKRYISVILKTFQNIHQEVFAVPDLAEFCLLDNTQHHIRKSEDTKDFSSTWNNLFNIYKFLKTMENLNFSNELEENKSYQLGLALSEYESGWKRGRENLAKTIQNFSGNISKKVYEVADVHAYYIDITERMVRNEIKPGEHNTLISLLSSANDSSFEKNKFIMGYFSGKNSFKAKEDQIIEI